jgi:hypothetical protein
LWGARGASVPQTSPAVMPTVAPSTANVVERRGFDFFRSPGPQS